MGTQGLTVRPADLDRIMSMLARAGVAKADTTMGAAGVAELCRDALGFEVLDDGHPCAAYALKIVRHEGSRVAWIMAAGGGAEGVDLTTTIMPIIEQQARAADADQIAITTRRRGLMHKLSGQGFRVAGITMRKAL